MEKNHFRNWLAPPGGGPNKSLLKFHGLTSNDYLLIQIIFWYVPISRMNWKEFQNIQLSAHAAPPKLRDDE